MEELFFQSLVKKLVNETIYCNIIKVYVLHSFLVYYPLGVETMFADLGHFSSLSIKVWLFSFIRYDSNEKEPLLVTQMLHKFEI